MEINHRANSGNDGSLSPSFHSPLDNLIRNKINLLVNICDMSTDPLYYLSWPVVVKLISITKLCSVLNFVFVSGHNSRERMASDQEGRTPGLQLLDKVRVGQAARPGPHLQLGERELDVELPEVGEDQLRHRAGGNLGHHAPVHTEARDVDNVKC